MELFFVFFCCHLVFLFSLSAYSAPASSFSQLQDQIASLPQRHSYPPIHPHHSIHSDHPFPNTRHHRRNSPNYLTIKPSEELITRPLGLSLVLTCLFNHGGRRMEGEGEEDGGGGGEEKEVKGLKMFWLGVEGRVIEESLDSRISLDQSFSSLKLIITKTLPSDSGLYTCLANLTGVLVEKSVKVEIFTEVDFAPFPAHQHLTPFYDDIITCLVTGSSKAQLSWKHNNKKLKLGDKYEKVEKGLKVKNVTKEDEGVYSCVAMDEVSGSMKTKNIHVSILTPVTVEVENDIKTEVVEGGSFNVSCHAKGHPLPNITFYKVVKRTRHEIKESKDTKIIKKSVNHHLLSISNATKNDNEGSYFCEARNKVSSRDVLVARVTVLIPVKILEFKNVTSKTGSDVTLNCVLIGWPLPKVIFVNNNTQETYRYEEEEEEEGEDGLMEKKENYNLFNLHVGNSVRKFPSFFDSSSSSSFPSSSSSNPSSSSSNPSSSSSNPSSSSSNPSQIPSTTYQLTLRKIWPKQAGSYSCLATNRVNKEMATARLQINYSPFLVKVKDSNIEYIWPNITKNISCHFNSQPSSSVYWVANGDKIKENEIYKFINGKNFSTLQILMQEDTKMRIYGNYSCVVYNDFGSTNHSISLKRAIVPDAPKITSYKSSPNSIHISLEEPRDSKGVPLLGYQVLNQEKIYTFKPDEPIKIKDLKPNTFYMITIKARNLVGFGVPVHVKIKTQSITVPMVAINPSVTSSLPFDHSFSWQVPSDGGMPVTKFIIFYREATPLETNSHYHISSIFSNHLNQQQNNYDNYYFQNNNNNNNNNFNNNDDVTQQEEEEEEAGWMKIEIKEITDYYYTLENLKPLTTYIVKIKALNALGWSPLSQPYFFTTRQANQADIEQFNSKFPQDSTSTLVIIFGIILIILIFFLLLILIIDITMCLLLKKGIFYSLTHSCFHISTTKLKSNNSTVSTNISNVSTSCSKKNHDRQRVNLINNNNKNNNNNNNINSHHRHHHRLSHHHTPSKSPNKSLDLKCPKTDPLPPIPTDIPPPLPPPNKKNKKINIDNNNSNNNIINNNK